MDKNSTAQVDKMSPEEAKVFLRDLLDHSAMRSPEVNQHVRKMLRGQRDQVAWFDRMEPGAAAECLLALVDAKPKKPIVAIVKSKPLCVKCNKTPRQNGSKHEGFCNKCSPAVKPLCVKCDKTPRQNGSKHEGCCSKCSPVAQAVLKLCVKCNKTPRQSGSKHEGCCSKCSPVAQAVLKLCVKCGETARQGHSKHEGCCTKCSPAVKPLCVSCVSSVARPPPRVESTATAAFDTLSMHRPSSSSAIPSTMLTLSWKMALYWLRQNDPEDPEWIEKHVIYIGMMGIQPARQRYRSIKTRGG